MGADDVRKQMMKLWKRTFDDSDEYIKLVFDSYYNYDLIEYESDDDKIVAAMLAVPYGFGLNVLNSSVENSVNNSEPNDECFINGLYLCGLATDEKFRGKGIMTKLIERINAKAESLNFDFTFLVPADAGLVKYYQQRDYVNAFYRTEKSYTTVHDFKNEYIDSLKNIIQSKCNNRTDDDCDSERLFSKCIEYFNSLCVADYNDCDDSIKAKIREYIYRYESSRRYLNMIHSHRDIKIVCEENYLSDGRILVAFDMYQKVVGVAVLVLSDDVMDVRCLYCDDVAVRARLLNPSFS